MANQELVKCSQRAKAELDRGAAQIVPSQGAEITAKIVPLQLFPARRLVSLGRVPAMKFPESLLVITLGVSGSAAVGREMSKELLNPCVADFGLRFWGLGAHGSRPQVESTFVNIVCSNVHRYNAVALDIKYGTQIAFNFHCVNCPAVIG